MLGKLFKHEVKATGRTFLPMYGALLILTIFTKMALTIGAPDFFTDDIATGPVAEVILGITFTLYVIVITALCVMTFVVIIQRFYKNLFTDEGYLMFSLPVKTWELILSKLLVGLMWSVVCCLMLVISIFILSFGSFSMMEVVQDINMAYTDFNTQFGMSLNIILFELFLCMLVSAISSILLIYASISIGQLFNQHRVLASFGAYIVITIVLQIIVSIILVAVPLLANLDILFSGIDGIKAAQWFINGTTLINLALCVMFYFCTQYIMEKHLNLE
ncbi:ABC transporter permease [Acetobacterium paludosum]|uniref:ABC transporter permease n=1 Tax=Acetobacterium paludosum TaxID=52693 RepID=A0A923HS88_9FIRM|nr:ABC transporter permease [Acetobacterium paludosum]MBC3887759.1 ABC transporter permease [Acetobacterium paludosum]